MTSRRSKKLEISRGKPDSQPEILAWCKAGSWYATRVKPNASGRYLVSGPYDTKAEAIAEVTSLQTR